MLLDVRGQFPDCFPFCSSGGQNKANNEDCFPFCNQGGFRGDQVGSGGNQGGFRGNQDGSGGPQGGFRGNQAGSGGNRGGGSVQTIQRCDSTSSCSVNGETRSRS